MRRIIIIQSRMTSTRLPGKILMDLDGIPMLAQQIRRLKRCRFAQDIVIATTTNRADDPLITLANQEDVRWYRGSEEDVLGRYRGAAAEAKAEIVVRVTSDCPLIDPEETDRVIQSLENKAGECDYAANIVHRTFPRGLDTEAFFFNVLERMDRMATSTPAREHVTYFLLKEHPELFRMESVEDREDHSALRWCVDTPDDFKLISAIYKNLRLGSHPLSYREILAYVLMHPELRALNAHVAQKTV